MAKYNYENIIDNLSEIHYSGYLVFENINGIRVTYVSKHLKTIFDCNINEHKDLLNSNMEQYVYKYDLNYYRENLENSFKKSQGIDINFRINNCLGKLIWIRFRGVFSKEKNMLVVNVNNNTVERQNENELHITTSAFNKIIEKSKMNYWEYDFKNDCIFYGKNIKSVFGTPSFYENFPYVIKTFDFVYEDDKEKLIKNYLDIKNQKQNEFQIEYRVLINNKIIHVRETCISIYDSDNKPIKAIGLTSNIEDYKQLESKTTLIDKLYDLLKDITSNTNSISDIYNKILKSAVNTISHATNGSILVNRGDGKFIYGALYGYNEAKFKNYVFEEEETIVYIKTNGKLDKSVITNDILNFDLDSVSSSNIDEFVNDNIINIKTTLSVPIMNKNKMIAIINLDSIMEDAFDSIDVKQLEMFGFEISTFFQLSALLDEQEYKITHDKLTDVESRVSFYRNLDKYSKVDYLPLSIVTIDVNGLKMFNDTFGHLCGNELLIRTASIIKKEIEKKGMIARLGGDEFNLLLPNTTELESENLLRIIKSKLNNEKVNDLRISISYGVSTLTNIEVDVDKVLLDSDSNMYKQKINEREHYRTNTVTSMMENLFKYIPYEKEHALTTGRYARKIGEVFGLDKIECEKLAIVGYYHDIGKVAVPKDILKNPNLLSNEDRIKLERHSETGYLILNTTATYFNIGNIILFHHENFDGSGYPRGIGGENIPLMSRIIRVADSIASMGSNRVYKNACNLDYILEELHKYSGIYYDPNIASLAIKLLKREGLIEYKAI